jgi:regulator of sirC expression with transglutaminase-like and TPR domain
MSDPRRALEAIGQIPDVEIDIGEAALQFARIDEPEADWAAARAHLSELARDMAGVGRGITDLEARAGVLTRLLVERHFYHGDAQTYDDLANANLIRVTERRRGMPVALGVIWLHACRSVGWSAHGVDFPGHFLIALAAKGSQLVLDIFNGGIEMEARDLRALIKQVEGEAAELRPGVLQPMSARGVLLRLQNNIKSRRLQAGDLAGALVCVTDMVRIAPDHASLWREAAVMHHRLDEVHAAVRCYERFLMLVPEGEVATRVRASVKSLRSRLN